MKNGEIKRIVLEDVRIESTKNKIFASAPLNFGYFFVAYNFWNNFDFLWAKKLSSKRRSNLKSNRTLLLQKIHQHLSKILETQRLHPEDQDQ